MAVVLLITLFLSGVMLSQGQQVGFEQADFLATDSNVISVRVNKFEYNSAPMNISVHPLTISQYEALGVGGCVLSSGNDPADADDFNTTVMEVFVPADTNPMVYTFDIALTQDNVVEPLEDFVVFLNVSGGDTVTVTRDCTVIKVKEIFNGQFLRWSHDGQEVTSTTLSLSYPEGNASHVIMRAERLVEAELTTTITIVEQFATLSSNEFTIPSNYSIPPERSFVDIVLTLFDDNATEVDETVQIEVIAQAPQIGLGTYGRRRVSIQVVDDEILNYKFLSPAHVTVNEGNSIIIRSGLYPMVDNNLRDNQLGRITTESGTATEGIDFDRVEQLFIIDDIIRNQKVRTISRAGVQPTRNFTVHLAPLLASNYTLIHGVVMIEILDTSRQNVGFEQDSVLATDSNVVSIRVLKSDYNIAPMTISVHPLTISQYEALGVGGCDLSSGDDPAEADDFNPAILEEFVPAHTNATNYTFDIVLTQDNVMEPPETFVVLLNVSGGEPTLNVTRDCVVVKVKEEVFNGQFLRWTHDGQEVTSMSLSLSYPEGNASHVIIRAERLVDAEVTTTITIMKQIATLSSDEFSISSSYTIPPERSFVDIVLTLFDDSAIEADETIQIEVIAEVPQISLGTYRSRSIQIEVTDDEFLNYEFLSPARITVIEGDNITLMSGLNPMVDNIFRNNQRGKITTENGTATERIDFHKVDEAFVINNTIHDQEVRTISRAGVQPTRSFTVHLAPLFASNYTLIHGVVTIEILDKSKPPLKPNITSFGFFKEDVKELATAWSQQVTDLHPLDYFIVIIKTCTKLPCEIDPDSPKADEKKYVLSNDSRELLHPVTTESGIFRIVVCAENVLGRNCSSSLILQTPTDFPIVREDPPPTFIIWVVIFCVLLLLFCCLLPLILLILCCLCKRDRETSYYPGKTKGKQLKGQSPDSSDSISIDSYMEEMKDYKLKYAS